MNISLQTICKEYWQPKPLTQPTVDVRLPTMNGLHRAAESWRYNILCWEYWMSSKGNMREWTRLNFRLFAWLFIPAVLVMPVITFILCQFTTALSMLTSICGQLIVLAILFLLALLVIRFVLALIKR